MNIALSDLILNICGDMSPVLDNFQLERLKNVMMIALQDCIIERADRQLVVYESRDNDWYVQKYLVTKQVSGCTKRTLQHYNDTLQSVFRIIQKNVVDMTSDDILVYFAHRDIVDKVTKTTQNNERLVLSSFFGWMRDEEYIGRNPIKKVAKIKGSAKKQKAFTELEVEQIRAACRTNRERALVECLLSTGCRVSELVQLKRTDIQDGKAKILGKGRRERMVYFNAKALVALERYLCERNDSNPYIFCGGIKATAWGKKITKTVQIEWYKNPDNIDPLKEVDPSTVESNLRKIGKRSGISSECHPHKFRRTCATMALKHGMELVQVSRMLGHSSVATTQIYLDLNDDELERAHKTYVV